MQLCDRCGQVFCLANNFDLLGHLCIHGKIMTMHVRMADQLCIYTLF